MPPERDQERSAGGVIFENGRVLLILMGDLKGGKAWTFPKGHLEAGETDEAAAVREVLEETGFECTITGELPEARYAFVRNGRPVDKIVRWYLMKRLGGNGTSSSPEEIFDMKWLTLEEAKKTLVYASDLKILDILNKSSAPQ